MLYDVYIHISILIATLNDYESDDDDYNESDNDDDSSEDDGDEDGSYSGGQKLSTIDKSTVDLSQHSSCPLCNHTLDKKNRKKTDQQTKDYIYEMTLEDIMRCSCRISNSSVGCKENDGNCIARARFGDVDNLRKEFWGSRVDSLITSKVRGEKLEQLLRKFYDAPAKKFKYKIGDVDVCERGFFILLGLMSKSNMKPGTQLKRVMNIIKGNSTIPVNDAASRALKRDRDPRSKCTHHAVSHYTL